MDFDLNPSQTALLTMVDEIVESCGGRARAFEVSRVAGYDGLLDDALAEARVGHCQSLLDRVLVAERLAELGLATSYGLRLVVLDDGAREGGAFAVADASRRGPVRYGMSATRLILLDDMNYTTVSLRPGLAEVVHSGFGYPYARFEPAVLTGQSHVGDAPELRDRWHLALAAEISGNAAAGIRNAAEHLQGRHQFGRSLSTFQALRHRLADTAVSADAIRWLVREAAFSGTRHGIDIAVSYAADAAAKAVPELVQMGGARSFALEFGMHVFTMRLDGLRLQLGGSDRVAAAALASAPPVSPVPERVSVI